MKIRGLDKLSRKLKSLQEFGESIDGLLGTISFDPNDPVSIENAVVQMETTIDARVGRISNSTVESTITVLKEKYRQAILTRAAEARLRSDLGK